MQTTQDAVNRAVAALEATGWTVTDADRDAIYLRNADGVALSIDIPEFEDEEEDA